jgi:hypothetical protein
MTRVRIAGAVFLLALAALALARSAPPIVNIADIAVTELYVDLASDGRLLVGPYSRFQWHHPGPLYFFAQAPLYVASGRTGAALFAGAWALNAAALGLMLWTLSKSGSAVLTIGVGGAVLVFAWRLPDLLASPWTAHVPILPGLALVTLAAAAAAGRTQLLPMVALLASFVAQTNLAHAPAVAVPVALLAPAVARALRSGGAGRRHIVQAVVVAILAWMPSIVDALIHRGGNAAALWRFFSAGGAGHSLREAFAAWSDNVVAMARGDFDLPFGGAIEPSGAAWTPAAAIAVTLLTLAAAVAVRRRRPFETWLGLMVAASLVVMLWSLTRIRDPIGDYHLLPVAALGTVAAGFVLAAAARALSRVVEDRGGQRAAHVAAIVICLAGAALGLVHVKRAVALQQRLPWAADVEPAVKGIEAFLDQARANAALVDVDRAWGQAVPIVLRLHQRHRRVSVTDGHLFMFTDAFAATARADTHLTIQPGRQAAPPGQTKIFDSFTIGVLARAPE